MAQRLVIVIVAAAFAVGIALPQAHGHVIADVPVEVIEVIELADPEPDATVSTGAHVAQRQVVSVAAVGLGAPVRASVAPPPVPPPER